MFRPLVAAMCSLSNLEGPRFTLTYAGDKGDDTSMPARELAGAIEAAANLAEAAFEDTEPEGSVVLRVEGIERSSVSVQFFLEHRNDMHLILTSAGAAVGLITGAISLAKWRARGSGAEAIRTTEEDTVLYRDGDREIRVPRAVDSFAGRARTSIEIDRIVGPLSNPEFERLRISYETGDSETNEILIASDDAAGFAPPSPLPAQDDEEPITSGNYKLFVRSPALEDDLQWKFRTVGGAKIMAPIADKKFIAAVRGGEIQFVNGTYLMATLKVLVRDSGTKAYLVSEVLSHGRDDPLADQETMFD